MAKEKKSGGSDKNKKLTNHAENQVTGSRQNLKREEYYGRNGRYRGSSDSLDSSSGYSRH